ncbi:MAG TPA: hypothetical protein VN516_02690 [Candidatus Baltobacteraceae bacterium]|nr:hypothetical protein [Candidatus Baltobacteraceae bacterium]
MKITFWKILSLAIAISYIVALLLYGHGISPAVFHVFISLLFPLILIWFPEPLGNYTGFLGLQNYIDEKTPAVIVSLTGWFFLVIFPLLLFLTIKYIA